jgi:hypothetical protein
VSREILGLPASVLSPQIAAYFLLRVVGKYIRPAAHRPLPGLRFRALPVYFTRGWVTFVQTSPIPEIQSSGLRPEFRFLRGATRSYPPEQLPSIPQLGPIRPISRAELLGLDRHKGVERVFQTVAPLYPVQIAPQVGIEWRVQGLKFTETALRLFLHSCGIVLTMHGMFQVEDGTTALTGFRLARVLNNLERNRGIRATSHLFQQPKSVVDIFFQLRRFLLPVLFKRAVENRAWSDIFCVFSPDGGEFPLDSNGLPDGQADRLALFSAMERFTGNENAEPTMLANKCFAMEASKSWIFGSQHGIALFVRPDKRDTTTTLARRCNHKNVVRLLGFYQLCQGYLAQQAGITPAPAQKELLQFVVGAHDRMAVQYSKYWIRWARARFRLDQPVHLVVTAYKLKRLSPPDEHALPAPVLRAFVSYSHADEKFRAELVKQLEILRQENVLVSWQDRELVAGQEFDGAIKKELQAANLVLLLVSADFLNSKYVREVEIPRAMERQEVGEAQVIPVILDETNWQGQPFARLTALPRDGRPASKFRSRRKACADIAEGLRALARKMDIEIGGRRNE